MKDTLLNAVVAVAILGGAFLVTHLFARWMYITCAGCGTLNARRRSQCRKCNHPLRQ